MDDKSFLDELVEVTKFEILELLGVELRDEVVVDLHELELDFDGVVNTLLLCLFAVVPLSLLLLFSIVVVVVLEKDFTKCSFHHLAATVISLYILMLMFSLLVFVQLFYVHKNRP